MVNDPVADVLIRIKNGYMAGKVETIVPYSKLVFNLCKLLEKEGFVQGVDYTPGVSSEVKSGHHTGSDIMVTLKYEGKQPALTEVKRVSKPGLRVYKGVKEIHRVLNGYGIAVISTPKGLMTDREARKAGMGGEVMAEVW
ncbi:MAG: rpsH [Microgenomates group bacterium Gr01-1014_80]|nr:MAG: rpsH [Microgenomates group bacterium Gr01-1014_80]